MSLGQGLTLLTLGAAHERGGSSHQDVLQQQKEFANNHRKSKAGIASFFSCYKSSRGNELENTTGHVGRRSQPRKQGPFTVAWSGLKGATPWLNRGLGWEQWHKSGIHQTGEALTALTTPFPAHNNQQHSLSKEVTPEPGCSSSSQHSQASSSL